MAVTINPGDSIQTAVNVNPAGTVFTIKAGEHRGQSVIPKALDQFVAEPGAVLNGNGAKFAFSGMPGSIKGVVVKGLPVTGYKTGVGAGAIRTGGGEAWDWIIDGCDLYGNEGMGIHADNGANWQVRSNRIHHNGQIGMMASGDNIIVENNEIDNNNTDSHDPYWEAGGTKFVYTDNLIVRGNHVHDNAGPGLWCDINNIRTLYDTNRVIGNDGPGIFHEVSYAAVIRNNAVERNGHKFLGWIDGAGILVSCSPDVEIYGNTLVDNRCGIAGKQTTRDDDSAAIHGPWELRNLRVHDNNIIRSGRSGLARNTNDPVMTGWGNRFYSNTYSPIEVGFWGDEGEMTKSQWRDAGQDIGSFFVNVWPVPGVPPVPAAPLWLPSAAVMLSWSAVTGATSYKVRYQKDGSSTSRTLSTTVLYRKISSLTPGLWRFWVAPVVGGVQQPWSAPAEVKLG